jgi:hypothetical protein
VSDRDIIPFGAAIASDVLSAFQLPGGATLTKVAEAYIVKKRIEAAEILIDEVSHGYHGPIQFDDHDVDPLIEIILRFSKAVADGAARENLKFLAQVIAGLKKHKALQGDQFRRWCAILEHLTRDELLVVGLSQVIKKQIDAGGPNAANDFWQRLEPALEKAGYEEGEIAALSASVSRTGLLTPVSAFSGMVYMPTPWLDQLGALADLESATRTQPKHAADKR